MTDAATTAPAEAISTTIGGASVTINPQGSPTPSVQLAAAADSRVEVKDSGGRTIILQKPKVLDQFRFVEGLGDAAKNETYMGMCLPLLFVVSIDGVPVVKPASKAEVELLITRLDEDGMEAIMRGVAANFGGGDEANVKNG